MLDGEGIARPYFLNAEYVMHRGEAEHGRQQHERDRISYAAENYEPVIAAGQARLVEGRQAEIHPGLSLERFPGHTRNMLAVHIESEGEHACFISDLIPTTAHLDLSWVMGFDLDPLSTIEERKRFYARAIEENWLVLFPHDHRVPMGYLQRDNRGRITPAS